MTVEGQERQRTRRFLSLRSRFLAGSHGLAVRGEQVAASFDSKLSLYCGPTHTP